jgi:hypothetical protein
MEMLNYYNSQCHSALLDYFKRQAYFNTDILFSLYVLVTILVCLNVASAL